MSYGRLSQTRPSLSAPSSRAKAQTGATLAEVMRRAGHSSAAAAMHYQHAADQRDAEIASRLSALAEDRRGRPAGSD